MRYEMVESLDSDSGWPVPACLGSESRLSRQCLHRAQEARTSSDKHHQILSTH